LSEIRANTISDAAGTGPIALTGQAGAKVWVSYNGQGTVAIRASLNVSSLTDNGTGQQTVSYTNNFASAGEYSIAACAVDEGTAGGDFHGYYQTVPAVGSFRLVTMQSASGSAQDSRFVGMNMMGDLA
jgi:hypothetical protein